MTSKAEQLFLELCLLRSRYSEAEIEEVACIQELKHEPSIRRLLLTLRELEVNRNIRKSNSQKKSSPRKAAGGSLTIGDGISHFLKRLEEKKTLRTREQINNFARSLGIAKESQDRQIMIRAIGDKLKSMPTTQAMSKIASVSNQGHSASEAFVDLAKTLMKS